MVATLTRSKDVVAFDEGLRNARAKRRLCLYGHPHQCPVVGPAVEQFSPVGRPCRVVAASCRDLPFAARNIGKGPNEDFRLTATTSFCVREAYAASCPHHLTMP